MILEGASEKAHVIGKQRRGKRITSEALQRSAVESEPHGLVAVDETACR
jgi:hypothetical protein